MQQITYENILGERITFLQEGYLLNGSVKGVTETASEFATLRGVFQQGETVTGIRRAYRQVEFTISIMGDSRQDMYEKRQWLCGVLSAEKAVSDTERGRIIYQNDNGTWWTYAAPDDGVPAGKRVKDYLTGIKLKFRCESPFWYSMTQQEAAFLYAGGGFRLPFSFPVSFGKRNFGIEVINGGHVNAPVEVLVEGRGEAPYLYNERTGQALRLTAPVPEMSVLRINTDPANLQARITDAYGNEESAFGLLAVDTPLSAFVLYPGSNRLTYRPGMASAKTDIRIRWWNAFEGV